MEYPKVENQVPRDRLPRKTDHHHTKRTHRGLDYCTPQQVDAGTKADAIALLSRSDLPRRESLGEVLKRYERKAGHGLRPRTLAVCIIGTRALRDLERRLVWRARCWPSARDGEKD